jgi:hypothetical protein
MLDTAWMNISGHSNLNILSHASGGTVQVEHHNLPSWLPLYDNKTVPFVSCVKKQWIFRAAGMTSLEIEQNEGSRVLRLRGSRVCTVRAKISTRGMKPAQIRTFIENASGRSDISSFWSVFLAGQTNYGIRLGERSVSALKVPPRNAEEEIALVRSAEFSSWPDFVRGRSFFLTASGSMGLGPAGLADGHVVVLLAGAPVPYVLQKLRLADNSYYFIGEWLVFFSE